MQTNRLKTTILLTIFLLLGLPLSTVAQNNQVFTLTADNLANGKTAELNEAGWKYHAGDDGVWANSDFDDAGWETLKNSAMTKDSLPQTGWNGSGWLRLNVAPAHQQSGIECLTAMERFDEAVAEGKLAEELDPLSPIIGADLGNVLMRARRFDESIAQLSRARS